MTDHRTPWELQNKLSHIQRIIITYQRFDAWKISMTLSNIVRGLSKYYFVKNLFARSQDAM